MKMYLISDNVDTYTGMQSGRSRRHCAFMNKMTKAGVGTCS